MESRSSTASSRAASAAGSSARTPLSLVDARCSLCGAARAETVATGRDFEYDTCPNEFRFVRCAGCGHLYLSPRPRVADLGVIYPADYYAFSSGGNALVARPAPALGGGRSASTARRWRRPRRILDVGCGGASSGC
jgi:hypothetical protein